VCVVGSTNLTTVTRDTRQIWTDDEVMTGAEFDDVDDTRQQPQSVTTT